MPRSDRSASYGNLARDGSHAATLSWANSVQTKDATTSPVTSPIASLSTSAITTLNVPNNAAAVFFCSTQPFQVSADSSSQADFMVFPSNTLIEWPCGGTNQTLYVQSLSGGTAGNLSFGFLII